MSTKDEQFFDRLDSIKGDKELSEIAYRQLIEAGLGKSTAVVLSGYTPNE